MDSIKILLFLGIIASSLGIGLDHDWMKKKLVHLEEGSYLGSKLSLSKQEKQTNKILMNYKQHDIDTGLINPSSFLPFFHFFQTHEAIANSKLYQLLRMFPKGANLHIQDFGMVSSDFLFNLTYYSNLQICFIDGESHFRFSQEKIEDPACKWQFLSYLREKDPTIDDIIRKQLSLIVENPVLECPNKKVVWERLEKLAHRIYQIITFRPLWKTFFLKGLQECLDDNIMYIEFRSSLPNLYDLDGTTYGPIYAAQMLRDALAEFVHNNPSFLGARLIYAPIRSVDNATAEHYTTTAIQLKEKFPDFIAGFDLTGCEDAGQPLEAFISQFEQMKKHGIHFIFHAGATNLFGTSADQNLFDAILLGSHRLASPNAIIKHPEILNLVKLSDIALEFSPISNQVLHLAPDFKSNPLSYLLANGYPVTIGSDKPGLWGATGLSYDWYIVFLALTGRDVDSRLLKQLALNSIEYSTMPFKEKSIALKELDARYWDYTKKIVELNSLYQQL